MTEVVITFRKSSYSAGEGNCVEVADTAPGGRAVRDSKQQDGPLLVLSRESWQAFLQQIV
ncbi:DUF397 domain-containing protein [Streptomyces sp. NBC_00847]|uniref:DUF397 domain-containing protein n=1 Tax=Streptomyces sp. NBC_00847 TaxID=2975850 RepID=UPI0022510C33|nr:DUF397 domain-containing protein [Streptomyces sp. NBC_00847]MCX4881636.1 DUF397 domain-containing protein [Streptomyces sp. NBC_00847]